MQHIDIESWPRRHHYRLYRHFDQPHFNICADVDVTTFYPALKARGISFTIGVLYVLARVANEMAAFRQRMRGDEVIEHEAVHPATTVLSDTGLFGFCTLDYSADLASFAAGANGSILAARQRPTLEIEPGRDDLLFTTSIPWVSFTSFAHPTHLHPADSIPRLAWGKRFEEGGRLKMPLSVQGHHALMDGLHIGQYFERVQASLTEPERSLGEAAS